MKAELIAPGVYRFVIHNPRLVRSLVTEMKIRTMLAEMVGDMTYALFAPDDKCAPRSTRSLLSTASGSGRPARCETRWPVDVARLASRRRAQALMRARQHAQQHAFIFVHADSQPTCIMIRFIAEQRPLAGSKRNRRANTTRAVPPFSRLQNACRCPTCSTPCSCDCSPASSAICTGDWSRTT